MPKPTATVTFVIGEGEEAVTLTLSSPMPGTGISHSRAQSISVTAAGDTYVYDKAVTRRRGMFMFRLTGTQRDNLIAFFDDNAEGAVNTFTFTDHLATVFTGCRFLTHELQFTKTPGGMYDITLEIDTEDDVD